MLLTMLGLLPPMYTIPLGMGIPSGRSERQQSIEGRVNTYLSADECCIQNVHHTATQGKVSCSYSRSPVCGLFSHFPAQLVGTNHGARKDADAMKSIELSEHTRRKNRRLRCMYS